jgi:general stress protein CsbA
MSALVGTLLALATLAFARLTGLDRSRAFYPCVLITIATYDIVFATVTGSTAAVVTEIALAAVFVAAAVVGYHYSLWIVAIALAAHGVADFVHDSFAPTSGIPAWWPAFCCAYDVIAGIGVAIMLSAQSTSSHIEPAAGARAR